MRTNKWTQLSITRKERRTTQDMNCTRLGMRKWWLKSTEKGKPDAGLSPLWAKLIQQLEPAVNNSKGKKNNPRHENCTSLGMRKWWNDQSTQF
jgi:hypothetical protein